MEAHSPDAGRVKEWADALAAQMERVFFGKRELINKLIVSLLAQGHVLLEDVPGTGKTIVARALAASLSLAFRRIQCTSDLLPADVLGVSVWMPGEQKFVYRKGPIISSVVLVDEINRATPRTQSALLEAMAEGQVSIDGRLLPLPRPFFVIATENPVEFEGTFPLPEAQKDRFLLSLRIGYPDEAAEAMILESQRRATHPVVDIKPMADSAEVLSFQELVYQVYVDDSLRDWLLALVRATRSHPSIQLGVSPRGSLALYRSAQAMAAIDGRSYVRPEDIKALVQDVFRKRLILSPEASLRGEDPDRVIAGIVEATALPTFKERAQEH